MKTIAFLLVIVVVCGMTGISGAEKPSIDNVVILSPHPWYMTVCPTSLALGVGETGIVKAWICPSYPNDEFTFPKKIKDEEGKPIATVAPAPMLLKKNINYILCLSQKKERDTPLV